MSYTHTHTSYIIYIGAQHMSTQHMSTEFISGRSTWGHSAQCDLLSTLYCSVMHLSFKWFLDRLLRYWLWPAWNRMEGNIWSTTCCMYFCNKETFTTTRNTTFPTEVYLRVHAFIYAFYAHTHVYPCIHTDCDDRSWCCGLWHLLPRGNLCSEYVLTHLYTCM